jgi:hypothetical protein
MGGGKEGRKEVCSKTSGQQVTRTGWVLKRCLVLILSFICSHPSQETLMAL